MHKTTTYANHVSSTFLIHNESAMVRYRMRYLHAYVEYAFFDTYCFTIGRIIVQLRLNFI